MSFPAFYLFLYQADAFCPDEVIYLIPESVIQVK